MKNRLIKYNLSLLVMTSIPDYLQQLRTVSSLLQYNMKINSERNEYQHTLYLDLYKIFYKQANKLANLANNINEEVLSAANQQEFIVQYYQLLSNSLLRLADCSRRVSLRFKSQILDPIKTFNQNYSNIYEEMSKKIEAKVSDVTLQQQEMNKSKENYILACQKFHKHKEMQTKVMQKIQSGNKAQLDKFNTMTKKMTQSISSSQKFYFSSVQSINQGWEALRQQFSFVNQSIAYNQDTRIAFFRKTIINSIKTFQQFKNCYDQEILKKVQEMVKAGNAKFQEIGQKKLRSFLNKIIQSHHNNQFVSYDDILKTKRKKLMSQDSAHLNEYFSKLKDHQKKKICELVQPWFVLTQKNTNEPISLTNQTKSQEQPIKRTKSTKALPTIYANEQKQQKFQKQKQLDQCKQRIISLPHHSMYFIQILYEKVAQLTSFYCKINEDSFLFLLNSFTLIGKTLDHQSDIGIQFIYKMLIISQRIMLKKVAQKQESSQPIQLLCQKFGKNFEKMKDTKVLKKLLGFLEKRKFNKKKNTENKGTLNNLAKGIFATFSRKAQTLNEDEMYSCIQELIKILANFSVPNEVILPFIKETLGNNYQTSYEYLKGLVLTKKDLQQRQSLFYRKEIKQKREQLLRKAIDKKMMGQYAIKIVAQHGYLSKSQIKLRILCRQLKDIHLQILGRLLIPSQDKWIRLIPINRDLNYIEMKQQVAQKSVPSAVEQIITLDVNRSLHLHGETLNPTVLHSLLRIYAFYHPDISYCQGMNYLVGYIYIKTHQEENTYRIFEYLMQVRFRQIFINQFQVLKLKMYQFQRLLAIFHPQISQHFKRQSISPQCYIVSWIITLFASSYQYTLSSYLIDFLWERFIIWGWPEFFRFVIWIFSIFKEELVEFTYDKALHFLGDLGRSQMFLSGQQKFKNKYSKIQDPRQGLERYSISQELLNKFAQQYALDQ